MQKCLVDIIGREAYGISVFTFHAFGSEIISRYREYFYNGADFNPADELTRHKIITDILQELPPKNPLKTMINGEFTSVGMIISAISDIKRAGLEPKELTEILDANDEVIDIAGPLLIEAFSARVNKNTFDKHALEHRVSPWRISVLRAKIRMPIFSSCASSLAQAVSSKSFENSTVL